MDADYSHVGDENGFSFMIVVSMPIVNWRVLVQPGINLYVIYVCMYHCDVIFCRVYILQ